MTLPAFGNEVKVVVEGLGDQGDTICHAIVDGRGMSREAVILLYKEAAAREDVAKYSQAESLRLGMRQKAEHLRACLRRLQARMKELGK